VTITPESLPDDIAALKRIIAAIAQDALNAQVEITKLKFQLARYRRSEFGRSSEKLARELLLFEDNRITSPTFIIGRSNGRCGGGE